MTGSQRILLNTAASYGRTLASVALGLLSGRWLLAALGGDDVGLFGAIGASIFFLQFFNNVLAGAVARFYAYSIGSGTGRGGEGNVQDVKAWFNASVRIHFFIAFAVAAALYPVSAHAIRFWLNVPPARMEAALTVLRLALFGTAVSMCAAPWVAMYTARQMIVELSVFQLAQSVLLVLATRALFHATGDRLVLYALASVSIYSGIPVIQAVRARFAFPACRLEGPILPNGKRVREFFSYTGWNLFGSFMSIAQGQGLALLVKRHLPLSANAAFSYAGQVSSHGNTLGQSLSNALAPAITTAEGSGNRDAGRELSFRACKFCSVLLLVVIVPLCLERHEVVRLWLKNPPPGTGDLCLFLSLALLFRNLTIGQTMAISATGKIAAYQAAVGTILAAALPVAWIFVRTGRGVLSVGYASALASVVGMFARVWFGRKLVGMSWRGWLARAVFPSCLVAICGAFPGFLSVACLEPSFGRVCVTTAVSVLPACLACWTILEPAERKWVRSQLDLAKRRFSA